MPLVVGVAFRPATRVYYFDPAGIEDLQAGERVVVETSRGRTLGRVVFPPREVAESQISGALKPVIRRATAWDLVQQDQADHAETETLALCRRRAAALGLHMKVVEVDASFDGSSVVVYFTAEQRIDFRNLVHDLAQNLHVRVEMRQVGVRDEAKFLDGLGKCGRQFCCASWLRDFVPVSIKMAKAQDLPLNTSEVSGVCGRLLCCLSYEHDYYAEARKQMPRVNSQMMTPQGPGKVKQVHVLRNSVTVQVAGPNETTSYVEVLVPEPVFSLPLGGCEGCAAARQAPLATSDEALPRADGDEEMGGAAEHQPPAAERPAQQTVDPARKAKSRRRRR